ncbi:hypothetical protein VTL71DRAFT_13012 [Oculimacula yallundae]|uniref:Uncharacterized protein n=1 Tax=Oculimacula yallundae TaxID=86028 RepID=A0ABR4CQD9_9HELO
MLVDARRGYIAVAENEVVNQVLSIMQLYRKSNHTGQRTWHRHSRVVESRTEADSSRVFESTDRPANQIKQQ